MAFLHTQASDTTKLDRGVPLSVLTAKPDGVVPPSKSSDVIYQLAAAAAALILLATMV
jgi:hypothetical protein